MNTENGSTAPPVDLIVSPLRDAMRLISGECEPDNLGSAYHDAGSCWTLIGNIVAVARCKFEVFIRGAAVGLSDKQTKTLHKLMETVIAIDDTDHGEACRRCAKRMIAEILSLELRPYRLLKEDADNMKPLFCPPEPRRGWRVFMCGNCAFRWGEPTRDRLSPSGECCPKCDHWCVPDRQWPDRELAVDEFGNLS